MTLIATPVPKSPFAELQTGPSGKPVIYITREWYRYLTSLTQAVGGNTDIVVDIEVSAGINGGVDIGPIATLAAEADSYASQNAGQIEALLAGATGLGPGVPGPQEFAQLEEAVSRQTPFPTSPQEFLFDPSAPFPMVPTELGHLEAAKNLGYRILEGGKAVLVGGTVTVTTVNAVSTNLFFLTTQVVGGTQGVLSVWTITANTSFVINSSNGADTSTVSWLILGAVKG